MGGGAAPPHERPSWRGRHASFEGWMHPPVDARPGPAGAGYVPRKTSCFVGVFRAPWARGPRAGSSATVSATPVLPVFSGVGSFAADAHDDPACRHLLQQPLPRLQSRRAPNHRVRTTPRACAAARRVRAVLTSSVSVGVTLARLKKTCTTRVEIEARILSETLSSQAGSDLVLALTLPALRVAARWTGLTATSVAWVRGCQR